MSEAVKEKIDYRALANKTIRDLTPYKPGKPIEELERELGIKSSIKLASNENPLGASEKAILAAQAALQQIEIYPDGSCYQLKAALSQHLSIHSTQLTIGNGSENILKIIIKSYLQPQHTAIISQYAFLTIPILLKSYGVTIKTIAATNWGHDIDAMLAAIDDSTKILFLVNPNNPTGTYTNQSDFDKLMQATPSRVLIVVDEAYAEYMAVNDYTNTLSYLQNHPNLILTRTFSKAHGLAGLRVGYAISSPDIADILNRARLPFNVNHIAEKAAIAALSDTAHVEKSVALNLQGKAQLETALLKLKLDYIPVIGNFITINVIDAEIIYQQLLYEGVIVRPLTAYDMPQHIRVTIGTYEQNERFISALTKCLAAGKRN